MTLVTPPPTFDTSHICNPDKQQCVLWGTSLESIILCSILWFLGLVAHFVITIVFTILSFIFETNKRRVELGQKIRKGMSKKTVSLFRWGMFWAGFAVLQMDPNLKSTLTQFVAIPFIIAWFLFTQRAFETASAIIRQDYNTKIQNTTDTKKVRQLNTLSVATEEAIRIGKYLALITVVIISMRIIKIDVISLLEGTSVLSLALVFAIQPWLRGLLGGTLLFADEKYSLTDMIRIGEMQGEVENITLRNTKIRRADNSIAFLPNSAVLDCPIENLSVRKKRLLTLRFHISHETKSDAIRNLIGSLEKTLQTLHPKLSSHMRNIDDPESKTDNLNHSIDVNEQGSFYVVLDSMYELLIWTYSFGDTLSEKSHAKVKTELILAARETMEKFGISYSDMNFNVDDLDFQTARSYGGTLLNGAASVYSAFTSGIDDRSMEEEDNAIMVAASFMS